MLFLLFRSDSKRLRCCKGAVYLLFTCCYLKVVIILTNVQVVKVKLITVAGSLKASVDFKINDTEFYEWLVIQTEGKPEFVASPSHSWFEADGTQKYKPLIKFPKKLHELVSDEILNAYDKQKASGDDVGF